MSNDNLHLGACIVQGRLHATVMRRNADGTIAVVATAEMDEASLRGQDCHAVMQPAPVWRCFHCDETFTDPDSARLHFGVSEFDKAACQISISHVRWMEAQLRRNVDDDSEVMRTFRGLVGEHEALRRRAEEEGYARGLRDAKKHPGELGLMPIPTAGI